MVNDEIVNYKREFYEEIRNLKVQVEDLKKLKISNNALASEIVLRKALGDSISQARVTEISGAGESAITKLDNEAIEFDAVVRNICEEVVDAQFDAEVELLMSTVSQE